MAEQLPKLKSREELFAHYMANGMTQTQAIEAIGYRGKRPKQAGWVMAKKPQVRAAIDEYNRDALNTAGITRVKIVKELARIAFADVRNVLDEFGNVKPFHELDADSAAAIAGMDVEELFEYAGKGEDRKREQTGFVRKLKFWNKREALSELAAIAKLKTEAPAVSAPMGPGLQVIVQQIVQQDGSARVSGQQVVVNLPGPA